VSFCFLITHQAQIVLFCLITQLVQHGLLISDNLPGPNKVCPFVSLQFTRPKVSFWFQITHLDQSVLLFHYNSTGSKRSFVFLWLILAKIIKCPVVGRLVDLGPSSIWPKTTAVCFMWKVIRCKMVFLFIVLTRYPIWLPSQGII